MIKQEHDTPQQSEQPAGDSPEAYTDLQQPHRDALMLRYPSRAKGVRAGYRVPKIEMFCIECMGEGTKAAIECDSRGCFLWSRVFRRESRCEKSQELE